MTKPLLLAMLAALSSAVSTVQAQSPPTRFICDVRQVGGRDTLRLEFILDPGGERAVMIGNNGMSPVLPMAGREAVRFVEFNATGAIQSTSIARDGAVVHSRHTLLSTGFVNTQFTGQCQRSGA